MSGSDFDASHLPLHPDKLQLHAKWWKPPTEEHEKAFEYLKQWIKVIFLTTEFGIPLMEVPAFLRSNGIIPEMISCIGFDCITHFLFHCDDILEVRTKKINGTDFYYLFLNGDLRPPGRGMKSLERDMTSSSLVRETYNSTKMCSLSRLINAHMNVVIPTLSGPGLKEHYMNNAPAAALMATATMVNTPKESAPKPTQSANYFSPSPTVQGQVPNGARPVFMVNSPYALQVSSPMDVTTNRPPPIYSSANTFEVRVSSPNPANMKLTRPIGVPDPENRHERHQGRSRFGKMLTEACAPTKTASTPPSK